MARGGEDAAAKSDEAQRAAKEPSMMWALSEQLILYKLPQSGYLEQ